MVDSFLIEVKVELDLKTKWLANLRAKVWAELGSAWGCGLAECGMVILSLPPTVPATLHVC